MANNGGMVGDVSLNTNQKTDATSGAQMKGNSWGFNSGDWVVNVPMSSGGLAFQGGASGGGLSLMWIAAAAAALLLLRRKKG